MSLSKSVHFSRKTSRRTRLTFQLQPTESKAFSVSIPYFLLAAVCSPSTPRWGSKETTCRSSRIENLSTSSLVCQVAIGPTLPAQTHVRGQHSFHCLLGGLRAGRALLWDGPTYVIVFISFFSASGRARFSTLRKSDVFALIRV